MSVLSPACHAFRDTIKKLYFVERDQVPAFTSGRAKEDLRDFNADPLYYFLRCPDAIAAQIWAAMEKTDD